jgi:proteasome lid subunit RPN8/RPN11
MLLERRYVDEMAAHAIADAPNECCGIIAGKDGRATKLYRAKNAEASPYRYNVESRDLIRINREIEDSGWEFFVIYHSHTMSEAYPSPTDVRMAERWPDPYYVVISLADKDKPVVRAFRIVDGAVTEEPIEEPAESSQ